MFFTRVLETGELFLSLFPGDSLVTHTTALNFESDTAAILYVKLKLSFIILYTFKSKIFFLF
jgi:hypothetical protein